MHSNYDLPAKQSGLRLNMAVGRIIGQFASATEKWKNYSLLDDKWSGLYIGKLLLMAACVLLLGSRWPILV